MTNDVVDCFLWFLCRAVVMVDVRKDGICSHAAIINATSLAPFYAILDGDMFGTSVSPMLGMFVML